jgi:hypothetical protein
VTRDPEFTWADFGWWLMPTGVKRLLTWNEASGELTLQPLGREPVIVLTVIKDEEEVRRRLDGWPDHAGTKDGLGWVAQRLEGVR